MPVSFLTIQQKERYGRYQATVSANDIAGYFYLNDDDLDWISKNVVNSLDWAMPYN
jgi:hypothetical protein